MNRLEQLFHDCFIANIKLFRSASTAAREAHRAVALYGEESRRYKDEGKDKDRIIADPADPAVPLTEDPTDPIDPLTGEGDDT